MVFDDGLQFLVVHDGNDLFGHLVHVSVTTLELERRLGAVFLGLGGAGDILFVDFQNGFLDHEELPEDGEDVVELRLGVVVGEFGSGDILASSHVDEEVDVLGVSRSHRGEDGVGGQGVLHVAEFECLLLALEDVAEVVGVGAIGQHVGDLELLAGFGVGVAGHDHAEPFAAEVVGARAPAPDPLDLALGVAQRNEFLEEFRVGVLDVVHIEHDVVAHLQGEVELFDLLSGGDVGGF